MPPPGPTAQANKTVFFIASDFRNGGVMGVYRGLEDAAKVLGWTLHLEDGRGLGSVQAQALSRALESRAHAVVFGGFDPEPYGPQLAAARQARIVLVGWHAAKDPGPSRELFVNIATRAEDVAQMAADYVLKDAIAQGRPVGVVLFNDPQFAVANAKTNAMKYTIESCRGYANCKVLAVENVAIAEAANEMPKVVARLVATHGTQWTYSLAINDVYYDEINFPLLQARRTDIRNVSAGDGSAKALGRIGAGVSQQIATVAEPLKLQGYQLADELNRAFALAPPSGYQTRPILVSTTLLARQGMRGVETSPEVESAYRAIWKRP